MNCARLEAPCMGLSKGRVANCTRDGSMNRRATRPTVVLAEVGLTTWPVVGRV